jgi:cytochrome c biogenesis protein
MSILSYPSSVKFAIILLVLIVIASVVGTIIPQDTENKTFKTLQLNDVYHSYWYTVLLVLFSLNLCLCSIKNIRSLYNSFTISAGAIEKTELNSLSFYEKSNFKQKFMDAKTLSLSLQNKLTRKFFYKLRYSNPKEGIHYFERGRIGRFGPVVTHASIIIIIIGVLIVKFSEFKEYRKIPVGNTIDVPNANFKVKADDFTIERYPDSDTPKQYITKLTIIENGIPKLTGELMVNHPSLKYKGIRFIQSAYGLINTAGIELSKKIPNSLETEIIGEFNIDEGSAVEIPDSNLRIEMPSFVSDFVMDSSGNVSSRSTELRNPAVLLELFDGNQSLGKSWRFLKYPTIETSPKSDYSMQFVSMYPSKYYTELQISSDSGISVIWIGSFLMIVGLFLSFFFSHKKLWVKLSTENEMTIVEIAGTSHKNRSGFEKESNTLMKLLQK